jgi:hypothetical protein
LYVNTDAGCKVTLYCLTQKRKEKKDNVRAMAVHFQRISRYDNWIIEKEAKPYLESFEDGK